VSAPKLALFPPAPGLTIIPHRGEDMTYRSLYEVAVQSRLAVVVVVIVLALIKVMG
jgi:hypothetical protein